MTKTVTAAAAMNVPVATRERGEPRPTPQTPWPLVQPAPSRAPKPTSNPASPSSGSEASTATGGKKLDGFVIAAVASGASATVYRNGLNTGLSGLTPGADYYLGTTAGTFTATPPSAAGQTLQYAGKAITATSLDVQPGPFVGLA